MPLGVVEIAAGRAVLLDSNLAMCRFLDLGAGSHWLDEVTPQWLPHLEHARSSGVAVKFAQRHPAGPLPGESTQSHQLTAIATHLGESSPGHNRYSVVLIENAALCTAAAEELDICRERIARLERQLASRKLVERAKWLLVGEQAMTEPDAHFHLQKLARDRRAKVEDIAAEIIAGAAAPDAPSSPSLSPTT